MLAVLSIFMATLAATAQDTRDYDPIIAEADRSDADRQTDVRRQPAKMLAFTGVRPGMKVLDMGAGAGYSTELLARVTGPRGAVYAQESAQVMERVKDRFEIRARKPDMTSVVHLIRNYDDPLPPEIDGLDLITFFFAYHDVTYMPADRAVMNKRMFAALKPGGFLVISDHSAKAGRWHQCGQDAAPDRGERGARGGRGGRLQAGGRGRLPAQSRGSARCRGVPAAGSGR